MLCLMQISLPEMQGTLLSQDDNENQNLDTRPAL